MSIKTYGGLFEGFGGFALGAKRAGLDVKLSCEIDRFCQDILKYYWPHAAHYTDITKTDFAPHRGTIDVLCGGFPCQGFSLAGNRKGTNDNRYLWPQMLRAVKEIRPAWVIGENVTGILSMEDKTGTAKDVFLKVEGGTTVRTAEFDRHEAIYTRQTEMLVENICKDLEAAGYDVQPLVIPAASVQAPHRRDRVWFIAHAHIGTAGPPGKGKKPCQGRGKNPVQPQERREPAKQHTGCRHVSGLGGNAANERLEKSDPAAKRDKKGRRTGQVNFENAGKGVYPNANGQKCNGRGGAAQQERQADRWEGEGMERSASRYGQNRAIAHPTSIGKRQDNREGKSGKHDKISPSTNWKDFPSQSPVCLGDDGLSARLDRITVHGRKRPRTLTPDQALARWRKESIKGGGNAVVPDIPELFFNYIKKVENEQSI